MEFFRFPHTPHVAWLGAGRPRDDKLLTPTEARALLEHEVVIEEKVDGAGVGFSLDEAGLLRVQSRGAFLSRDACHPQFRPLFVWLASRREALTEALFPDLMLFGEWCWAVHSVRYTKLPDWFLAFDVYDRSRVEFWSANRRNELARTLGLDVVPRVAVGRFDLAGIEGLLGRSQLADGPPEGLYLRRDEDDRLVARAKLVRAEFTQAIDEHWSRRPLERNALAEGPRRPTDTRKTG